MKRFTATDKWSDPWFRRLKSPTKFLWLYLLDNCDNAGVIELDFELASFHIGEPIDELNLSELGNRIYKLPSGKLLIMKFVDFQWGRLNPDSNLHKPVIKLVLRHFTKEVMPSEWHVNGVEMPSGCHSKSPLSHKVQVQVKEITDGGMGEGTFKPTFEQACDWLAGALKNGADYTKGECHSAWLALNTNGWMWGKNPVTDWRSGLERQIQTDRDRKHHGTNSKNTKPGTDRNSGTYNEGTPQLYRDAAARSKSVS